MFKRGHMKPLGSHRPPDFTADELKYMISPEDFYMNYVVAHKPVVIKGESFCFTCLNRCVLDPVIFISGQSILASLIAEIHLLILICLIDLDCINKAKVSETMYVCMYVCMHMIVQTG